MKIFNIFKKINKKTKEEQFMLAEGYQMPSDNKPKSKPKPIPPEVLEALNK